MARDLLLEFWKAAADGHRAALVTLVRGPHRGAKLLVSPDRDALGDLGSPAVTEAAIAAAEHRMWQDRSELVALDDGTEVFVQVNAPPPRLFVFGAGAISAAVCRLAELCGWESLVIDSRKTLATPESLPHASQVLNDLPAQALAELGGLDSNSYVAVLYDDVDLGDSALSEALRSPAAYIGAIGSRTARAARRGRLVGTGFRLEEVDRIYSPIGLDQGGASPYETAVSIVAELIAVRNQRRGDHLSATTSSIHRG